MPDHPPLNATCSIGRVDYRCDIRAGAHTLSADLDAAAGGAGAAPGPFDLLLSALTSCICMTVRMYALRKGWPLEGATASASAPHPPGAPLERVDVALSLLGPLDDAQRTRLTEIAHRCPVHRTLSAGVRIEITG